jgi:DNA topoisomerase-2
LKRFNISKLSGDMMGLMKRRVYDMAGILKVKVYLNGRLLQVANFK